MQIPNAPAQLRRVIVASSVGTVIEYYDFFIFAAVATVLAQQFYPPGNETFALLGTLATFAIGVAVRPFGSLLFGKLGDTVGRKTTFLITLLMMGGSTAAIGLLPTYASIGVAAPLLLILLRMIQGLALGGEYAGAATYVAEHAPEHRRGFYTSFIQVTPTVGLCASSAITLGTRALTGESAFVEWGWRIPFLVSVVLLGISYYIRSRLQESPIFAALKAAGKTSATPVRDSYSTREAWKTLLIVVFGVAAGQGVVAYTSQIYVLLFLQKVLAVPTTQSYIIVATALLLIMPFYPLFGWLSDRVGRKPLMVAGNLLAVATFYPIYLAMTMAASPLRPAVLTALVFLQMLPISLVLSPLAAFLVEMFPARIRYTSISLPYNLGNGWFGGFLPLIATALVARTGHPLSWLIYPCGIALIAGLVGLRYLPETRHRRLWDEVGTNTS
jgi:MFS family permease